MTPPPVTYTLEEAKAQVGEEGACLSGEEKEITVLIHPMYTRDQVTGVKKELEALSRRYNKELGGVVVAYEKLRLTSPRGWLFDTNPFMHVRVSARFFVFCPAVGNTLKAVVRKKSPHHLGCLAHGSFNISVPRPARESVKEWPGTLASEGDTLTLTVLFTSLTSYHMPFIRAAIHEDCATELRVKAETTPAAEEGEGEEGEAEAEGPSTSADLPNTRTVFDDDSGISSNEADENGKLLLKRKRDEEEEEEMEEDGGTRKSNKKRKKGDESLENEEESGEIKKKKKKKKLEEEERGESRGKKRKRNEEEEEEGEEEEGEREVRKKKKKRRESGNNLEETAVKMEEEKEENTTTENITPSKKKKDKKRKSTEPERNIEEEEEKPNAVKMEEEREENNTTDNTTPPKKKKDKKRKSIGLVKEDTPNIETERNIAMKKERESEENTTTDNKTPTKKKKDKKRKSAGLEREETQETNTQEQQTTPLFNPNIKIKKEKMSSDEADDKKGGRKENATIQEKTQDDWIKNTVRNIKKEKTDEMERRKENADNERKAIMKEQIRIKKERNQTDDEGTGHTVNTTPLSSKKKKKDEIERRKENADNERKAIMKEQIRIKKERNQTDDEGTGHTVNTTPLSSKKKLQKIRIKEERVSGDEGRTTSDLPIPLYMIKREKMTPESSVKAKTKKEKG